VSNSYGELSVLREFTVFFLLLDLHFVGVKGHLGGIFTVSITEDSFAGRELSYQTFEVKISFIA